MRCRIVLLALFGAPLLSVGCKEKRSERVAASYSTVTQATERPLPAHEAQKVPVGVDAVPVEEDYEVRATSSINEANMKAKLAEIEQELRL